jgi:ribosome-associated translation inhibitor RaiA
VAEADGNRTRQNRVATVLTGFEVRARHQRSKRFRRIFEHTALRSLDARAAAAELEGTPTEQGDAMSDAVIAVHFKDMPVREGVRSSVEDRCRALAGEFPELTHVEVTLAPDGSGHSASGRVTGKSTVLASHALAPEPGHAADKLLDTLRHQLRRQHDKRIFAQRRVAQKVNPKRRSSQ